jgi:hypothetical protein
MLQDRGIGWIGNLPASTDPFKSCGKLRCDRLGLLTDRETLNDLNYCASSWVAQHAGDEGNYGTRSACLQKATQLIHDFDVTPDRCQANSEGKGGDK